MLLSAPPAHCQTVRIHICQNFNLVSTSASSDPRSCGLQWRLLASMTMAVHVTSALLQDNGGARFPRPKACLVSFSGCSFLARV